MNIIPYSAAMVKVKCYVYAHLDPVTKEVFYIGKGYDKRAFDVVSRNREWTKKHKELKSKGLIHEVRILHVCDTDREAFDKEQEEIRNSIADGKKLVNIKMQTYARLRNEILEDFGSFVRENRKAMGVTQKQLGKLSGLPQTSISKIEIGLLNITLDTILKVTKALGFKMNFTKEKT